MICAIRFLWILEHDHLEAFLLRRSVLLGDHFQRNFAGTKSGNLRGLRKLGEAFLDLAFDLRLRHRNVQSS